MSIGEEGAAADPKERKLLPSLAGSVLARYIKLVSITSRRSYQAAELAAQLEAAHPCIFAIWHGQFMMMPKVNVARIPIRIMVARHGDAEIIGQAITRFDMELIRGAGAGARKRDRGGAQALRAALTTLRGDYSVAMTADVPPGPARVAGTGIITLARMSGRPIVPVGIATNRYLALKTWSRFTVNLPFSRLGITLGEPIFVPRKATPDELEALRLRVEQAVNDTTARAYALARANPARATPPRGAAQTTTGKQDFRLRTYNTLTSLVRPALPAVLSYRERQNKEDPARRPERFGIASTPRPEGRLIWAHAASVGELNALLPLLETLTAERSDLSFLVTTGTVTSARLAAKRLGDNAVHQYLPLDCAQYSERFLDHWRPDMTLFTESEIWPNHILACRQRNIPMVLVNGRLSLRSFNRWRRNAGMAHALFGNFDLVLAQSPKLANRFSDLGARQVIAVGNLKVDAPALKVDEAVYLALSDLIGERPLLLAASTHDGEDEIIAAAHDHLKRGNLKRDGGDFLTFIAPRHPDRAGAIASMLRARNLKVAVRSKGEALVSDTDIYLADTIGELGTLYKLADIAFIGGSLVKRGGQNPIEAIRHDACVLTGPHWTNFRDEYKALIKHSAVGEVATGAELAVAVQALLDDRGELAQRLKRARGVLDNLSGALGRSMGALLPILPSPACAQVIEQDVTEQVSTERAGTEQADTAQDSSPSVKKDVLRAS